MLDGGTGRLESMTAGGLELLGAPAPKVLVIRDEADSWGTGVVSWRDIVGEFKPRGAAAIVEDGPIRTIIECVETYRRSRIVRRTILYPDWNAVEIRLGIIWNEERRRLKLAFPTALRSGALVCEVPGGAIVRPADGEEHVHGRWCSVEDRTLKTAVGIAHNGLHGLDFKDGELRLSVLRSAAYCHERGFKIGGRPARKFADLGPHDIRILLTAGKPDDVLRRLPGWADYLAAPPAAFPHLPLGPGNGASGFRGRPDKGPAPGAAPGGSEAEDLLSIWPPSVRLLACKRSRDGRALIVRLQESAGRRTKATLTVAPPGGKKRRADNIAVRLGPFEMETLRIERSGKVRVVDPVDEI